MNTEEDAYREQLTVCAGVAAATATVVAAAVAAIVATVVCFLELL